jgi:hypothetical protein
MKTPLIFSAFVLLVLTALVSTANAKLPLLLEVPSYLKDSQKKDLTAQRADLEKRLTALRKWANDYNVKCGNRDLPEDDPLAKECLADKARLDKNGQEYTRDALAFDDLVLSLTRVGAVAESRGEFYFVTPDGRQVPGEAGAKAPVSCGTRIVTGPNGHLQTLLLDETVFTIGPNSDMVIDEFVFDPDQSLDKISARLQKGVFRWVTGKVSRKDPGQMKVTLPVGCLGIRGTDFEAMVAPDDSGSVKLYSGQLDVTEKKTQRTFLLNAGQMVTFSPAGVFSPPAPLEPATAKLEAPGQEQTLREKIIKQAVDVKPAPDMAKEVKMCDKTQTSKQDGEKS